MNTLAPRPLPVRAPHGFLAHFAAAMPRLNRDSLHGRVLVKLAALTGSAPGTAIISLSGVLAALIGVSALILTVARGMQSLMLLTILIYGLLFAAIAIIIVSGLLIMTILHLLLGDELWRRVREARAGNDPIRA